MTALFISTSQGTLVCRIRTIGICYEVVVQNNWFLPFPDKQTDQPASHSIRQTCKRIESRSWSQIKVLEKSFPGLVYFLKNQLNINWIRIFSLQEPFWERFYDCLCWVITSKQIKLECRGWSQIVAIKKSRPHVVFKFCCNTRWDMSLASWEVINQSFIFNHHSSWKGGGWRGPLAVLQMSPKLGFGLLLCIESILDGIFVHFSTLSSFLPYCPV